MTLSPEYVHQRMSDPTMKARDVGRAIGLVLASHYPTGRYIHLIDRMQLDSGTVSEMLGEHLVAELAQAGYSVTFTGRRPGTHR